MFAEQTASSRFSITGHAPALELRLAVRVEIPGEPGVDVSTVLLYEPKLPEHLQDTLHQALYDGVHGGLATVDLPLPPDGVAVTVLDLGLDSSPETMTSQEEIDRVADTIQAMMAWIVAGLWDGLDKMARSADSPKSP